MVLIRMADKQIDNITFFIPLRNFGWKYNGYLLDKNTKIRFIDEATENKSLKDNGLNYLKYKTVLIYKHNFNPKNTDEMFAYIPIIEKIIIFLKLYLSNDIYYEKYFRFEELNKESESFKELENSKVEDAPELRELWKKYQNSYTIHHLSLNWYSRSLDPYIPPKESILFLTLSLEGILLSGLQSELSYRFALRGAFVIGNTKEERNKYFQLLDMAYKYRSAVVHNNEAQLKKVVRQIGSSSKFHQQLLNYTEEILKLVVENPFPLTDIENKILNI